MHANPLAPAWLQPPVDANALAAAVWPANAHRGDDGMLMLAGVRADDLVERFGTPVYVMDEADVRERATRVRAAFLSAFGRIDSTARVYYAGKAFLSAEVARWVAEAGLGIDVASGGELAVALAAGTDPATIGVHGNAKSDAELRRAIEVGVGSIVIDSFAEVERVAAIATELGRVQPVRLRINSGVHASTHEYLATAHEDQKFGVPLTRAVETVDAIRLHESLRFLGLHSHIGSQIFESDGFSAAISRLMGLHARLLQDGPVPQLNLGGGFGIAYTDVDEPRPIEDIANDMAAELASAAARLGVPVPDVALEPGRSIVGPAGVTLYRVEVVKPLQVTVPMPPFDPARDGDTREDTVATRTYVSVDGGMSDNIRPALYRAEYSARIASRVSTAEPILARVAGKHCEGGDIVVHAEYLPGDVERGDLLAVPATGAYGWAMASNYNWIARPPVVAVRDGVARVIVHGETIDDLLRRDAGLDRGRTDSGQTAASEGSTTSD